MDFQQFQHSHSTQLASIPNHYWKALHEKLQNEVYDAGKFFRMDQVDDGWQVVVTAEDGISTDDPSSVFLVDHAWTFQSKWAHRQLQVISGLAERVGALMGLTETQWQAEGSESDSYDADSESGSEKEEWSESDTEEVRSELNTLESTQDQLAFQLREDGYDSGDLGDVSLAYTTEAPPTSLKNESSPSSAAKVPHRTKKKVHKEKDESSEEDETVKGRVVRSTCEVTDKESGEKSEVKVSLPNEKLMEDILAGIWRYCHAYHISNSLEPMWYIMDEFGSRIGQSSQPTVAMHCFFYIPTQLAFSVIWPLKKLSKGDLVTCNYLPSSVKSGLDHQCHSIPWTTEGCLTLDSPLWKDLDQCQIPDIQERCDETLPDLTAPSPPPMLNYNVFTDMKLVESHLKHPSFHIVSSREEADILWLSDHYKDFRSLRPGQLVNQFPCENVITCKDLLAAVATRGDGGVAPSWLPLTFNLLYELPKLVHEYMQRKDKGEDNLWIIKPWNLGRSLDIHISSNLPQIVRLAQIGPKVGCKYISDPVLFHRQEVGWVKFDYRYVVLLRSVQPLEAYVYDVFWLRFANKSYDLEWKNLSDYEVHFTVMNYDSATPLKQIHYDEFIPLFEKQYPDHKWSTIEDETVQLFKELLISATSGTPPGAIFPFGPSRAIYAADLMLEKVTSSESGATPTFQPRLLEMNYCPDCACVQVSSRLLQSCLPSFIHGRH